MVRAMTCGRPGMAPRTMSSMLGWVAAVSAMLSPSQPNPLAIHKIFTLSGLAVFIGIVRR